MDLIIKASAHCKRIQPCIMIYVANFSGAIAQLGILDDAFQEFGVCTAKFIRQAQKIEEYY